MLWRRRQRQGFFFFLMESSEIGLYTRRTASFSRHCQHGALFCAWINHEIGPSEGLWKHWSKNSPDEILTAPDLPTDSRCLLHIYGFLMHTWHENEPAHKRQRQTSNLGFNVPPPHCVLCYLLFLPGKILWGNWSKGICILTPLIYECTVCRWKVHLCLSICSNGGWICSSVQYEHKESSGSVSLPSMKMIETYFLQRLSYLLVPALF